MRRGLFFFLVTAISLCLSSARSASIIPDSLEVDFRDPAWTAAHTRGVYTVGGVTLTARPGGSRLYQSSIDGMGIFGGQHDEIDWWESLEVAFAGGMQLKGAWFTDLFPHEATREGETGRIQLYRNDDLVQEWVFQGKDSTGGNGDLFLSFGDTPVTATRALLFAAQARDNEYALAGFTAILPPPPEKPENPGNGPSDPEPEPPNGNGPQPPEPTPVPIPAPGALVLAGLGLGAARRLHIV